MRKHELSSLIIVPKLRVLRPVEDVKVLNRCKVNVVCMMTFFLYSLSVHRVADPGYRMAGLLYSSDMTREMIFDLGPIIRQRLKLN